MIHGLQVNRLSNLIYLYPNHAYNTFKIYGFFRKVVNELTKLISVDLYQGIS